jgi:hypothetical protein
MPRQSSSQSIVALTLCLLATGCSLSTLAKHPAAFSTETGKLVDNTSNAYRAAIDLHDQEQVEVGAIAMQSNLPWDFRQMKPLISPEGLKARLVVLDALKTYAQSLADVSAGVDSPALTAAATSTGTNLKALGENLKTDLGGSSTGFAVTAPKANLVSSATLALGEFLVARKIKANLPAIIQQMDPQIDTLSKLLADDIETIRAQSKKDDEDLIRQQWVFIHFNKDKLSPTELRAEIEKLPAIEKSEQSNDAALADLHAAIEHLATTHHALALAVQGKDKVAVRERIGEFGAAGANLDHYYLGLSAK